MRQVSQPIHGIEPELPERQESRLMFAFQTRMNIRRDNNGVWQLNTGAYMSEPIPHPTWSAAWRHARFISKLRNGDDW